MPAPRKSTTPPAPTQAVLPVEPVAPTLVVPVTTGSRVRSTNNTTTHIKQPGTSGQGRAHYAGDIAFEDASGSATVQSIIEALLARVSELEGRI